MVVGIAMLGGLLLFVVALAASSTTPASTSRSRCCRVGRRRRDPLGTDQQGRDMLAVMIVGTR
jgi:ABC-type dipeptide/oligopeptide/nickel transport system permease subunit